MYAESQERTGHHTADEVDRAISKLTAGDLGRLKTAARTWVRGFGLDPEVHGADDLVSEAMFRTVQGRRRWQVGVELPRHLITVMRSIAESWRKGAGRRAAAAAAEVRENLLIGAGFETEADAGEDASPVTSAPSRVPGALRLLLGDEQLQPLLRHFAGDEEVRAVLHGWWWGWNGPEIQESSGLSKRQYRAAALRIRRYAQRQGAGHDQ